MQLTVSPVKGGSFGFGRVEPAAFEFTNRGDRAVVVKYAQVVEQGGEDPVKLTGPVYGTVSAQKDGKGYELNSMDQRASDEVFSSGFLLPGKSVRIKADFRFLSTTVKFKIAYLTADGAYTGKPESLIPLQICIPGKSSTPFVANYLPFDKDKYEALIKDKKDSSPPGPDAPARAVLAIEAGKLNEKTETVTVTVPLEGAVFPIEQAVGRIGEINGSAVPGEKVTYSMALRAYVVSAAEGCWLLRSADQTGKETGLPLVKLTMFKDIDSGTAVRVQVSQDQGKASHEEEPPQETFWGKYPVTYGDGMYTSGKFIELDDRNLAEFLKTVKEKKGEIKSVKYFFDSRYFQLVNVK